MLGASRISKLRVIVISDVRASRVISDFDPSLSSDNDADSNLSNISPPGNMQMCRKDFRIGTPTIFCGWKG